MGGGGGGDSIICFCYTLVAVFSPSNSGQGSIVPAGTVVGFLICVFILHSVPDVLNGLVSKHSH